MVPTAVSDLLVEFVSYTSVILSWTAPGDDGSTGTAAEYDVRYSTSPITELNLIYATQVSGEDPPHAAGEDELLGVSGLSSCTTYYFAIKTRDECHNGSALGTAEGQRTLCGGGGFSAAQVGGERSAEATGVLGLPQDQLALELAVVDGVPEWTSARTGSAELGEEQLTAGIHVQVPDGEGGWETRAHLEPAAGDSLFGIRLPYAGERRVVFSGDYSLRHVSGRTVNRSGVVVEVAAVTNSRLGDVSEAVDPEAGGVPPQEPGDTLRVSYAGSESADAERFFVVVGGTVAGSAGESHSTRIEPPAAPPAFALSQGEPNPVSVATTIRFDLPRAEYVRLEVFDLQGRRLATLAEGWHEAGSHALEWRPKASTPALPPGVYLYRLSAGLFRAQHKLVVLP